MKAKLRLLEMGSLIIVIILNVYLLNANIIINRYEKLKESSSTANYINIEEDKNEIKIEETVQDNIVSNLDNGIKIEDESEIIEENPIIYDGKTIDELSELINKSLNSTISGKGYLIASHSIEMGVDPYMATAIILQETGCKWTCSRLVIECNNVGGQKGTGCGNYSYFNTLDEGIIAFIDNLANNYINYGLITPEQINSKYAEDTSWATNVNAYIDIIKAQ